MGETRVDVLAADLYRAEERVCHEHFPDRLIRARWASLRLDLRERYLRRARAIIAEQERPTADEVRGLLA